VADLKRANSPQDESAVADLHRQCSATISNAAGNLSKTGWSWGCVSAIDSNGRTIWIVDAHRGDGKRFVVRADEKLTAFQELESAICACGELSRQAGEISPKLPQI
jgi:hypothetical protein